MFSVVIDTNVLVSGLLSNRGNPGVIVNELKNNRFNFYFNAEIIEECKDVLHRKKLGLRSQDVNELIDLIKTIGVSIIPDKSDVALLDEDDRIFYDLAKSTNAYLITGNTKHYPNDPLIVTPARFVELLSNDD